MTHPDAIVASVAIVSSVAATAAIIVKWRKGNSRDNGSTPDSRGRETNEIVTKRLDQFRDGPCAERSAGIKEQVEITRRELVEKIDDTHKHTKTMMDTQQLFINDKLDAVVKGMEGKLDSVIKEVKKKRNEGD